MIQQLTLEWLNSESQIPQALWDNCFPAPYEGQWWYRSLECSHLERQFTFTYGLISYNSEPVAIAPAFVMELAGVGEFGGKGNVVMFVFDAFPPVQQRGVIADTIFKHNPDIKVLDRVTPDVKDGGIADSRAKMEAILAANPKKGSIAAVWAAWDQPALGALQAIEAAGRTDEGIVITGIDANPQAREAIAKGGNFEASMAQDFKGIGATTAEAVKRHLGGEKIKQSVIYVPTTLITSANAGK